MTHASQFAQRDPSCSTGSPTPCLDETGQLVTLMGLQSLHVTSQPWTDTFVGLRPELNTLPSESDLVKAKGMVCQWGGLRCGIHLYLLPASQLTPLGLSLLICKVGARPFLSSKRLHWVLGSSGSGPPREPRRDRGKDDVSALRVIAGPKLVFNNPFWN